MYLSLGLAFLRSSQRVQHMGVPVLRNIIENKTDNYHDHPHLL